MREMVFDPEQMRGPGEEVDVLARQVIGAAIEVHRTLGPGFLEATYERAMSVELDLRGIAHVRQHPIALTYKGHDIGENRADLLVADQLIVELKAVDALLPIHTAQTISYLKATGLRLALLINFNQETLRDGLRRIAL
jgi:GxxExxY protein